MDLIDPNLIDPVVQQNLNINIAKKNIKELSKVNNNFQDGSPHSRKCRIKARLLKKIQMKNLEKAEKLMPKKIKSRF